jgi:hypothetical protein
MVIAQVVTVLRAWSDNPDASLTDFPPDEQARALRVVTALRNELAAEIKGQRVGFIEGLREAGEPKGHIVSFSRGSEQAERIVKVAP